MTKRTLTYIVNHYTAAMAALHRNCFFHRCKSCPFLSGNYCTRTNDTESTIEAIKVYLKCKNKGV